jgi:hypothetical protein
MSEIRASAMLLLQIVGNQRIRILGGLQWHNVQTKFRENSIIGSGTETCGLTDTPIFYARHATNA